MASSPLKWMFSRRRWTTGSTLASLLIVYLLCVAPLLMDRGKLLPESEETKDTLFHETRRDHILVDSSTFAPYFELKNSEWRLKPYLDNSFKSKLLHSDSAAHVRVKRELLEANQHRIAASEQQMSGQQESSTNMKSEELWSCSEFRDFVPKMRFVASGWTKAVHSVKFRNKNVAIKLVDITGKHMTECIEQATEPALKGVKATHLCYNKSASKIIRELLFLYRLKHPNIVKLFGYCIPNEFFTGAPQTHVALMVEYGEPVDLLKLLQMPWEQRVRIYLNLAQLLYFFERSPLGSAAVNDFRRQQFVLVDGELKLSDLDDLGLGQPTCVTNADCRRLISSLDGNSTNSVLAATDVGCEGGFCQGFNELKNLYNTARYFTGFLLSPNAPDKLKSVAETIEKQYKNLSLSASTALASTEALIDEYRQGLDGQVPSLDLQINPLAKFTEIPASDLPGKYEYACEGSYSQISCVRSVRTVAAAAQMCLMEEKCRAFVWTQQKTWLERNIVHFKNDYSPPTENRNTILYVKSAT